ncbi:MAG TPA: hypothetical protein DDW94_01695 [Deltaproteobacteria bacterium]|nr:MAG: hypothetical protein A2Z79_07695 [Deltaproteobacteria bacterium GWA2_55_82]OGQ65115.1 MAG: hypothetical protein A3I81_07115 [Deltaproteobacteria bacterium RIFCSPLOWO2_02_FULL_55_12]OIJ74759.1 MAG: hypothetical protein A2V21_311090 [Deltaproteobacteria bacterium GWC2_55_46]HBG45687.1 hypothetical protein [Deltaproteobacteria bacterium]HCY12120.1 hypothetical protein [Deltaproteobacteria bacterium]
MKVRSLLIAVVTSFILCTGPSLAAEKNESILFHLKTSLKHDDAQICVAYNMIWAALESGLEVNVLIDADTANTFKTGWFGRDDIEKFPLPERLRKSLSEQFNVPLKGVPVNYGRFLDMLHQKGARFHINSAFLVLAKIEKEMGKLDNISAKFFKPVTLKEMIELRTGADYYMAY